LIEAVPVQIVLVLKYDDLGGDIVCGTTTLQNVALFSISSFNGENPSGIGRLELEIQMILEH
jgi:hypothetical protein